MLDLKNSNLEDLLFEYVDRAKEVISSELWGNILLNSTKNEVFILILLYRNKHVNMTQIAEYVNVPLNTATGIVTRMEKRNWICRNRNPEDKRVVTIGLTEQGLEQIHNIMNEFIRYGTRIMQELTNQELQLLDKMFDKIMSILNEEQSKDHLATHKKVIKKIIIE